MSSVGLGPVPVSDVAEMLATLLDSQQLGALRQALAAQSANAYPVSSGEHVGRQPEPGG
ncbi:MAG: hypothetical protein ACRDYD_02790 [Acidimicrobiales bacterium]